MSKISTKTKISCLILISDLAPVHDSSTAAQWSNLFLSCDLQIMWPSFVVSKDNKTNKKTVNAILKVQIAKGSFNMQYWGSTHEFVGT